MTKPLRFAQKKPLSEKLKGQNANLEYHLFGGKAARPPRFDSGCGPFSFAFP
jgi:hypothetical protein